MAHAQTPRRRLDQRRGLPGPARLASGRVQPRLARCDSKRPRPSWRTGRPGGAAIADGRPDDAPGGRSGTSVASRDAGQGDSGAVWDVALSGDGRLLASGGMDGTVRLLVDRSETEPIGEPLVAGERQLSIGADAHQAPRRGEPALA